MKKYKTMKSYINDTEFEEKLKGYKFSAKHLNNFYDIDIFNNKEQEFNGIYYHITNSMINNIVKFNNLKRYNFINRDHLIDSFNSSKDKLIENFSKNEIRFSGKIEGEIVDEKKIEKVNYNQLFSPINDLDTTLEKMRELNKINSLDDKNIIRNDEIGVIGKNQNKYIYKAIPFQNIKKELIKLIDYTNQENITIIDVAMAHIIFELIHPMTDGNGRFGRFWLLNLLINKLDVDTLLVFNISENINNDKDLYYKNFEKLENKYTEGDCTLLIEYIIEKIVISLENNKNFLDKNNQIINAIYSIVSRNYKFKSANLLKIFKIILRKDLFKYDVKDLSRLSIQKELNSNKKTIEKNLQILIEYNLIIENEDLNTKSKYYKINFNNDIISSFEKSL